MKTGFAIKKGSYCQFHAFDGKTYPGMVIRKYKGIITVEYDLIDECGRSLDTCYAYLDKSEAWRVES